MKKKAIIALVCINAGLLLLVLATALPGGDFLPQAKAQSVRGASNYLMVTGQIEHGYSVVYVLDLAGRKMLAWQFDRSAKRLVPFRGRNLMTDFGRR